MNQEEKLKAKFNLSPLFFPFLSFPFNRKRFSRLFQFHMGWDGLSLAIKLHISLFD